MDLARVGRSFLALKAGNSEKAMAIATLLAEKYGKRLHNFLRDNQDYIAAHKSPENGEFVLTRCFDGDGKGSAYCADPWLPIQF